MHFVAAFILALIIWVIAMVAGLIDRAWWTPYLAGSVPVVVSGLVLIILGLSELVYHLRGKR